MGLELISEQMNGLKLFSPKIFDDERGFFMESYRKDDLARFGVNTSFVQDNHSGSKRDVLRGMHFQWDKPQGKLIRVLAGTAWFAEVDIRHGSPTQGKWAGFELSAANRYVLWVPPGFANGFCALDDWVEVHYKCTELWNPAGESSILWNDPILAIDWPVTNPLVSRRDAEAQTFGSWLAKSESLNFDFQKPGHV